MSMIGTPGGWVAVVLVKEGAVLERKHLCEERLEIIELPDH